MTKTTETIVTYLAFAAAVLLSSCDGGPNTDITASTAEGIRAEVLDEPLTGDRIVYTTNDGEPPTQPVIVFSSPGQSLIFGGALFQSEDGEDGGLFNDAQDGGLTDVFWQYEKVSPFSFTIAKSGDTFSPEDRFPVIVDILLGSNSSLATEFRELILRDEPDFQGADLERLSVILNTLGGDVIGNTVDDFFAIDQKVYTHESTSTEADQLLGTSGGLFRLDVTAKKIDFRRASANELSTYRFLSEFSWIPYIRTLLVKEIPLAERGTWVLEFVNTGSGSGAGGQE